MRGRNVGKKPLFDGMCADCACLLYGSVNGFALSNKKAGPPIDRDGSVHDDPKAQPPCLLRFSPQLFAKEAPSMFEHDLSTNCLRLKPGSAEPWLRRTLPHQVVDSKASWLYCRELNAFMRAFGCVWATFLKEHVNQQEGHDCYNKHLGQRARQRHIPFRDKASQGFMREPQRGADVEEEPQEQQEETQREPEEEPRDDEPTQGLSTEGDGGDMSEEAAEEDAEEEEAEPEPPEQWPSLEEYKLRWDRLLCQHSAVNPGAFSTENLVPEPLPALWQDCPWVPFDALKSDEAQGRLSRCRPISGLQTARIEDGINHYSHNVGEVNFRRRAPLQLASTMGFVLNNRNGKFLGISDDERAALHECLTWLRPSRDLLTHVDQKFFV